MSDTTDTTLPSPPLKAVVGRVMSLGEAADQLQLSKPTVRYHLKSGQMKYTRNGAGHYEIPYAEVMQFKRNREEDLRREQDAIDTVEEARIEPPERGGDEGSNREVEGYKIAIKVLESQVKGLQQVIDRSHEREILLLTDQSKPDIELDPEPERAGEEPVDTRSLWRKLVFPRP